jgi:poly(3-hydroxybutyrate) depolymerase
MRAAVVGLAGLWLAACATPPEKMLADEVARALPEGAEVLRLSSPATPPLTVFVYRPPQAGPDADMVIILHGVQRDAGRYFLEWVPRAQAEGFVLAVPEFRQTDWPRNLAYSLGNLELEDGTPVPPEAWAFGRIEPLFDTVRDRLNLTRPDYVLYGHSAGSQFVHRAVLAGAVPRARIAIAANAGWYTFPDEGVAWPHGLGGLPEAWKDEGQFARPLIVLLGEADNDPNHRSLTRTPETNAQGPHRFARGQAFFARAEALADEQGEAFAWRCAFAPGLAHDNALAAKYASEIIMGRQAPPEGGPCLRLPDLSTAPPADSE